MGYYKMIRYLIRLLILLQNKRRRQNIGLLFSLIVQCLCALVILFPLYYVYAIIDSGKGLDGILGILVIQPFISLGISIATIIICIVIGLPIRLNKHLRDWWRRHFYIPVLGAVAGLIFIGLSFLPTLCKTVITPESLIKQQPNTILILTGWFLLAFGLTHFYLPLQSVMRKITKQKNYRVLETL